MVKMPYQTFGHLFALDNQEKMDYFDFEKQYHP